MSLTASGEAIDNSDGPRENVSDKKLMQHLFMILTDPSERSLRTFRGVFGPLGTAADVSPTA